MHIGIYLVFLLAVAYSSSIVGLSSLVGTAPNVYLKGFVETSIGKHDWKYESIAKGTPLAQRTSWDSILLLGAGLTIATAFE
ncbi:unnamed protein product, partial [Rotaria magnacalcarata]